MKFNEDAIAELQHQIVQNIEGADSRIRVDSTGKPVDQIVHVARTVFSEIGVTLTDEDLHDYALSVSESRPHKFNINM